MRALILAAGLGERLRPLTLKRAKPSIEFLNVPMLGFPYYWLSTVGLKDLVCNTHYLPETVRHAAMSVTEPYVGLYFTHEPTILGSGGGIWNARAHLEGDKNFMVANGDGVVLCEDDDTLKRMLAFHEKHDALATLLVCPLEGVGTRIPGVWMDAHGEVGGFGKSAKRPFDECFHYASYMILSHRIWDYLPEGGSNILYDVLEPRIAEGERVFGFRVDQMRWYETGNVTEYLAATRDCLNEMRVGSRLGQCATAIVRNLARDSELQIRPDGNTWLVDRTAEVSASARLRGFAVLGHGASVGPDASLENCVVLPEARVNAGESLVNQVIG